MRKRIIVEVMRAPCCLAIKLVWLGVVVVAAFTLLFIRPATRDDHTSVLWDPNAPVILVADDADGDTQPHHKRLVDRSHISVNESTVWTGHHGLQQTGSSRAKLFLLYAFPHGGGGLASEAIFNVHPNQVFFLHQPLHQLPSTIFHLKSPGEWVQLVLNCSLGIAGHLLHQPHLWKSSSLRLTHASHCRPHQMDMAMCVAMACQRRNFRAVFTSQLAMEEIEELLNVYQYLLKIVVVVRDPRALLAAGLRSHPRLSPHQLELQANKICFTMAARISSARSLQHRFPSSVLVRVVHLHHNELILTAMADRWNKVIVGHVCRHPSLSLTTL